MELFPVISKEGEQEKAEGSLDAIIKIFSHYCQHIIDRQNKSLDKNFLAYLNLLGASLRPAQPARVYLTFTMAKGANVEALIPKGTQVAAHLTSGRRDMVVYETEADFVATSLELVNNPSFEFQDDNLNLYFRQPTNRKDLPRSTITLYFSIDSEQKSNAPGCMSWQYSSSSKVGWSDLAVDDETNHFSRSGFLRFIPPADFSQRDKGFCIRAPMSENSIDKIRAIHPNTTSAIQAVSVRNEVLGSSDGSEKQIFYTARLPILAKPNSPRLEVRDPAHAIEEDHWISWEEKPDFYTSGPHDRHYVINHVKGEIHFGDGHHGMIPPLGKKNIRMAYYQSGGGVAGNQSIGSIVNLITTIPYVKSVINNSPATGGADQESLPALMERVPRSLRHQRRAVTLEDYEDLAKEASTEVARAKCIQKAPGSLSLMIVPRLADQEPKPAPELKAQIRAFLTSYSDPCVSLEITESEYVKVVVSAVITVVPSMESSRIEQTIAMRIAKFLHPLTGGFDGLGWEFNRIPYLSDLYRLLETMTEVDHVDSLKIDPPPPLRSPEAASREKPSISKPFLISSGAHSIQIKRRSTMSRSPDAS
jgi:hypothetical protein